MHTCNSLWREMIFMCMQCLVAVQICALCRFAQKIHDSESWAWMHTWNRRKKQNNNFHHHHQDHHDLRRSVPCPIQGREVCLVKSFFLSQRQNPGPPIHHHQQQKFSFFRLESTANSSLLSLIKSEAARSQFTKWRETLQRRWKAPSRLQDACIHSFSWLRSSLKIDFAPMQQSRRQEKYRKILAAQEL